MSIIHKVGAIILKDRKILVAKKRDTFIMPGGRIEPGETDLDCLRRELEEELQVQLQSAHYFRTFEDAAALDPGMKVIMKIYLATIAGEPKPSQEITEVAYVDSHFTWKMGSIVQKQIIPLLVDRNLLN